MSQLIFSKRWMRGVYGSHDRSSYDISGICSDEGSSGFDSCSKHDSNGLICL